MQESLGVVETQTVRLFTADEPFTTTDGDTVGPVDVAFETYGALNESKSNAIFILHALTGDAHAAGLHAGDTRPGWWDSIIGPGKPVDTNRFFVICANLLGGCQGTTGPSSANPATGEPYGLDFPMLSVTDLVNVHRALLRHLGIGRLLAAIGGSLGGMQVLDWGLRHPEELANAIVVAASSRLTAQNIAFSAVARRAIMSDENFKQGRYALAGVSPDVGLAIARMMAHITYVSEDALSGKFGRELRPNKDKPGFGIDFQVESYLAHQGEVFLERFDALSYVYLSRVMDYFDPFAEEGITAAIEGSPLGWLVLSFDTDWRFGTGHSRRIVRWLEGAAQPVTFREIPSPWGHDSFLLKVDRYHATVRAFLDRALEVGL
ncbi:MAG: homoserine O-acetyltransferase [Propionibacteriaceae bacterium]|jgi:homoserine O-acetyltransferase|nr:homoserine O-acetyltransferase [Propionibacteriaceae bacterium]